MRTAYRDVADPAEAVAWLRELGARTVVLDVEPLVAGWDTEIPRHRRPQTAADPAVPGPAAAGVDRRRTS
jgi:hypothetical protein